MTHDSRTPVAISGSSAGRFVQESFLVSSLARPDQTAWCSRAEGQRTARMWVPVSIYIAEVIIEPHLMYMSDEDRKVVTPLLLLSLRRDLCYRENNELLLDYLQSNVEEMPAFSQWGLLEVTLKTTDLVATVVLVEDMTKKNEHFLSKQIDFD